MPEITCPRTTRWNYSSLDLLNEVWAKCASLRLAENVGGNVPNRGSEVRIGWDGESIHGIFTCQDPDPWATKTTRDDSLWEEEVVEIFLDPFGDGLCYFEIEINPLNTVCDLFIRRVRSGLRKDLSWDCADLTTTTGILPYGWTAGFRIPFESLGDCHPDRSPIWRGNFARIDRPKDGPRELSAWSPTLTNTFHVPQRFGTIRFANQPVSITNP
jgi:translation initiation factor IF-1